jgi:hypothetical protein
MGQLQDMMMRTQGQPTGRQLTQGMVANPPNQQEDPRRLEEHMMRTQGQMRGAQPSPTMGMEPPAPSASQFAGRMDPQVLQSIVDMMSATQGGMPPAPAGKTVRPPSPSANSNIRGVSDSDTYDRQVRAVNSAAQQYDDPNFGTSDGKYPGTLFWENPEVRRLQDIRSRAQVGDTRGGYNQQGPIQSRTPEGGVYSRFGIPSHRQMELYQNGFFDEGGIRYFLNDYGELETTHSPGADPTEGYRYQSR